MSFIDVLASSDAVVTKIGYATFVEAACNGVGIVSAPRADWPESGSGLRSKISDQPMTEEEWAKERATVIDAEPVAGSHLLARMQPMSSK
jgi:hypothetical protein